MVLKRYKSVKISEIDFFCITITSDIYHIVEKVKNEFLPQG